MGKNGAALERGNRESTAKRSRRLLVLIAVGVVALLGVLTALAAGVGLPQDRVRTKPVPLTEEQLLDDLSHLPGPKRVAGVDPSPDPGLTADRLQRHGPFRIVPPEFAGRLPYKILHPGFDPGEASYDPAVVRKSPLYLDVANALPEGFALVSLDTDGGAGVRLIVRQVFEDGKGRQIEIARSVVLTDPVDAYVVLSAPAGRTNRMYETKLGFIRGNPALLTGPTAQADATYDFSSVEFIQSGIKVAVLSHGLPLDTTIAIAESVAAAGAYGGSE